MAKYEWSEVFMSIEGEAKYAGHPTVYIRFARCNFQCRGFNNPENVDTTSIDVLGFDPKKYNDIYSIPLILKGCDSIYSWDKKFEHMWKTGDAADLGTEVLNVLPHNSFVNPISKKRVILSVTGGEPTLRMKFIPELLNSPAFEECEHVLIETNCSVPLKMNHLIALKNWITQKPNRFLTWSNSPKLYISGENQKETIRPDIVSAQRDCLDVIKSVHNIEQGDQYFKFVCDATNQNFDEVEQVMKIYTTADSRLNDVEIYIMPVACIEEQQQEISAKIAEMCMDHGYIYCHRIQNSVFGNTVGT